MSRIYTSDKGFITINGENIAVTNIEISVEEEINLADAVAQNALNFGQPETMIDGHSGEIIFSEFKITAYGRALLRWFGQKK